MIKLTGWYLFLLLIILTPGCEKELENQKIDTLTELHDKYKNGKIAECIHNDEIVFKCSRNAYDGGSEIFDLKGQKIGECYYLLSDFMMPDPICSELSYCKIVYCVEGNIWGQPAVDMYNFND